MSIYRKIQIIFLIAAIATTAYFGSYLYLHQKSLNKQLNKRHIRTSLYLHRHFYQNLKNESKDSFKDENLKLFLKESDFVIVKRPKRVAKIIKSAKVLYKRKVMRSSMRILQTEHNRYLSIKNKKFRLLLLDKHDVEFPREILLWYIIALISLMTLYMWLIRSLTPLKELQSKIEQVTAGDLSISVKSQRDDEIAHVANAFDDALRKLESLINSRQLFLRSIMHELKTPIGKGKLLNEFLEDNTQKSRYEAVFERLELLIAEFSKIERMLSSSYSTKLASYNARDIIEQSLELMIMDEDEIADRVTITEESTYLIYTDFEMLALAIKNLIDNALKYSPDGSVKIEINQEGITLSNKGARFADSILAYTEPFHAHSHGLGLGLYIVLNIIDMLSLEIEYRYTDNKNTFFIYSATT